MAEGRNWHAACTTERIKNLRPLAVMRTNDYRKDYRRHRFPARYFVRSFMTFLLLAMAALSLGTLLAVLRWPF